MRSQPVPHLFLSILTGAYRCRILPLVVLPDTLPPRSASRSRLVVVRETMLRDQPGIGGLPDIKRIGFLVIFDI